MPPSGTPEKPPERVKKSLRSTLVVDHVLTSNMRHQNGPQIYNKFNCLTNPAREHYVGFPNFGTLEFSGPFSGPNSGPPEKFS